MHRLAFEKELPGVLTRADNLPSLPGVAIQVLSLCQDEESTIADLAACIARDPSLSAKLLKLANSSLFGLGKEVTSMQRATMVLGLKTVKLMSLSFTLLDELPKRGTQGGFDFSEFWRRSLISAVAARSLCARVSRSVKDEAFLCGLFGYLGRLVLSRCMPEEYGQVLEVAGSAWPSQAEEERLLGFHSRDVCATLLRSWDLPRMIYVPVGYVGRSDELPQDEERAVRDLVSVLEVVELAEAVLCDADKAGALGRLHERARDRFGLSDDEVDAFFVELEPAIEETAELLSVQLPPGISHAEIIDRARQQTVDVSLGTMIDLKHEQQRARELEGMLRELADRVRIDALTGLPRRTAFDEYLAEQVSGRIRGSVSGPLGLLMIDVDRFKRFNDTYGHVVGDQVLRLIGRTLARGKRKHDLVARYGGEEFALVASIDSAAGLKGMAERLRRAIEQEHLENDGQRLNVTASFGGAFVSSVRSESDGVALVELADRQLYRAKRNGRNRCEIVEQHSIESGG